MSALKECQFPPLKINKHVLSTVQRILPPFLNNLEVKIHPSPCGSTGHRDDDYIHAVITICIPVIVYVVCDDYMQGRGFRDIDPAINYLCSCKENYKASIKIKEEQSILVNVYTFCIHVS